MGIDGQAEIREGDTVLQMGKGDSVFLEADAEYSITTASNATLYKATTP